MRCACHYRAATGAFRYAPLARLLGRGEPFFIPRAGFPYFRAFREETAPWNIGSLAAPA